LVFILGSKGKGGGKNSYPGGAKEGRHSGFERQQRERKEGKHASSGHFLPKTTVKKKYNPPLPPRNDHSLVRQTRTPQASPTCWQLPGSSPVQHTVQLPKRWGTDPIFWFWCGATATAHLSNCGKVDPIVRFPKYKKTLPLCNEEFRGGETGVWLLSKGGEVRDTFGIGDNIRCQRGGGQTLKMGRVIFQNFSLRDSASLVKCWDEKVILLTSPTCWGGDITNPRCPTVVLFLNFPKITRREGLLRPQLLQMFSPVTGAAS